ncbi:hypothetical protein [Streptomyces sp. NPDC018693]|uniref:hypothetical protein n=1 Tax=unclassified Streptomyces TaxID=2593676 RepID=UPI00379E3D82
MTDRQPDGGRTPGEPDGTPSGAEDVWLKFLTDSEHAIRTSAPREPSARERAQEGRPGPLGAERAADRAADAVGDLWQPEDPWAGPAWRDLDGRERLRRIGRVVATAAVITVALGAWSWLSTGAGAPSGGPGGTTAQHLEEAPEELPSGTRFPTGPAPSLRVSSSPTTG